MEIRQATQSDIAAIKEILTSANLPLQGVEALVNTCWLAIIDEQVVGVGAYAPYGASALIRSFAVAKKYRGGGIARQLFERVLTETQAAGIENLYLLTEDAQGFFRKLGFITIDRKDAPTSIQKTEQFASVCPESALLMWRNSDGAQHKTSQQQASDLFDFGYFCAESALKTIAEQAGIESPLIPRIATGFCSGVSRTCGMCGALTGGVLALNLHYGRDSKSQSVEDNYRAVQNLVDEFKARCGSTNCQELLGCDLGTKAGQQMFVQQQLYTRCTMYTGVATEIATRLIGEQQND